MDVAEGIIEVELDSEEEWQQEQREVWRSCRERFIQRCRRKSVGQVDHCNSSRSALVHLNDGGDPGSRPRGSLLHNSECGLHGDLGEHTELGNSGAECGLALHLSQVGTHDKPEDRDTARIQG